MRSMIALIWIGTMMAMVMAVAVVPARSVGTTVEQIHLAHTLP